MVKIIVSIGLVSLWVLFLILFGIWFICTKILTKYRMTVAEVSFNELLLTLNATVNTELELWENDIFIDHNAVATNSRYENYYHEICNQIIGSLSPIFFINISKYITEDEVVSIIGRRVKIFLNEKVQTI